MKGRGVLFASVEEACHRSARDARTSQKLDAAGDGEPVLKIHSFPSTISFGFRRSLPAPPVSGNRPQKRPLHHR